MAYTLTFDEYDGKYKRIINSIEIDEPIDDNGYYEHQTSIEEPLSFDDDDVLSLNTLFINDKYFLTHLDEIKELVIDTILSTTKDTFQISIDELIAREVIRAIASNNRIKQLSIFPTKGLNKRDIFLLLLSNIKQLSCTVNYDSEPELLYEPFNGIDVVNYPTIGGVGARDFFCNKVNLVIDYELSSEELKRLKKLFELYPQDIIRIEFEITDQMDEILSLAKSNFISLKNNPNWGLENYERLAADYDNIMIEIKDQFNDDIYVKPETLIEKEKILSLIINEVKSCSLSPLEQYMYLYNITKMYKEYKEIPKDESNDRLSRDVIYILFNEYMVCVGYVLLLEELVKKLNNPNLTLSDYSCYIEDNVEVFGHKKALVKITDEKYGIDGIYISDPTWDSVEYYQVLKEEDGIIEYDYSSPKAQNDYYNHFLMTKDEAMDEDIEYASTDVSDVLFKFITKNCKNNAKEWVSQDADATVKKLYHKPLMTRNMIDNEVKGIRQEPIPGSVISSAIRVIYSKIYSCTEEELDLLVENTVSINAELQNKSFSSTKDKFIVPNKRQLN